ncbi:hypothetical protein CVT26_005310 [Gymnopilus dilepis]|uniref:Uncharacterized protein n=1 Tax=Gymnopilus dilepis TaxID=231916 RepID=A0A409XAS7_9AGAR|nr:hypothetical protein CVT26_005310 [Gymnopilus dilepis]
MLEPSMAAWWNAGRTEYLKLETWEAFQKKIKARFMPKGYKLLALRTFFRCTQGSSHFLEYATALATAHNDVDANIITPLAYKCHLLFHAHETLISRITAISGFDLTTISFDDLTALMSMQWENLVIEGIVRNGAARPRPGVAPAAPATAFGPLTDTEKEKLSAAGGCWKCRKTPKDPSWTPHVGRTCPGDEARGITPGRDYVPPSTPAVKREVVGFAGILPMNHGEDQPDHFPYDDDTSEEEGPARRVYAGAAFVSNAEATRLSVPDHVPEHLRQEDWEEDEYSFYDISVPRGTGSHH